MLQLASDSARDALAQFGLAHVRVWVRSDDDAAPQLAGSASAQSSITYGGMREAAVIAAFSASPLLLAQADAQAVEGIVPNGGFLGLPLRHGAKVLGYLECYGEQAISFGDAAAIEAWAREIAAALDMEHLTAEMEAPRRGEVVLADDDPAIRKLLVTVLTRNGFGVTAVANGMLAYEAARSSLPDLILLDWMMPVLDGVSTAARLKSDPQTRHIPIVMLTGQARTEDKVAALEAGAQDYLTKPFDSRELVARIEQQLRWRKLLEDTPSTQAHVPPAVPASGTTRSDEILGEPPPPPNGDYWTAAVQAQQIGQLRHAFSYFMQEAENCDRAKAFPRAAIAFRSASAVAGQLQHLDLSNKLLRLSGKMYLSWAENTSDGKAMQDAYVNAARCFLSAGNLKLARKSVEFAESMNAVMADDRPPAL